MPHTSPAVPAAPRYLSKSLATWLAFAGGALGAHRFYLHGAKDALAWAHPLPTLAGLVGAVRMRNLGQDDMVAWALIPLLGLMLSIGMLSAIVIGLTPDEKWAARHNPGQPDHPTGWAPVLGAIAALLVGGAVLMGTLAFGGQRLVEWQLARDATAAPSR
jgi:hypothetical protein